MTEDYRYDSKIKIAKDKNGMLCGARWLKRDGTQKTGIELLEEEIKVDIQNLGRKIMRYVRLKTRGLQDA